MLKMTTYVRFSVIEIWRFYRAEFDPSRTSQAYVKMLYLLTELLQTWMKSICKKAGFRY